MLPDVGISVLDTSQLANYDSAPASELTNAIIPRHLVLGERPQKLPSCARRFLYGETEYTNVADLKSTIESILNPQGRRPRTVIVVAHNLYADVLALRSLIDFDLLNHPSVDLLLDTWDLARYLFSFRNPALRDVLDVFDIDRPGLHDSGNDALYTLKALLLLFRIYKSNKMTCMSRELTTHVPSPTKTTKEVQQEMLWQCQLELLSRIATTPTSQAVADSIREVAIVAHKRAKARKRPRIEQIDVLSSGSSKDNVISLLG